MLSLIICLPSIIVTLECTLRSTAKLSINFLRISALHEEITCPVWSSRIWEQSMWCKSEVSLNKYGHHHISTNCFILVWETLPLLKNTIQQLGYQQRKKLYFLHLTDREENENKALHQRSRSIKTWSINEGRGSEAKSVNDNLSWKAVALSEIRKRSSNSRK